MCTQCECVPHQKTGLGTIRPKKERKRLTPSYKKMSMYLCFYDSVNYLSRIVCYRYPGRLISPKWVKILLGFSQNKMISGFGRLRDSCDLGCNMRLIGHINSFFSIYDVK